MRSPEEASRTQRVVASYRLAHGRETVCWKEFVQMGRSLLVEASKTLVDVHWSSYHSVYLQGMSQRNGSAGTNCSNIRFRGGVAGSPLSDQIGGVLRSSDAYWKSIGLSVERLSNGLLIGKVQTGSLCFRLNSDLPQMSGRNALKAAARWSPQCFPRIRAFHASASTRTLVPIVIEQTVSPPLFWSLVINSGIGAR